MLKTFYIEQLGETSRKAFYAAQAAIAAGDTTKGGDELGILTKRVFETQKFDDAPGAATPVEQAENLLAKTKFGTATSNAGAFQLGDGKFAFFGRYETDDVEAAVEAHLAKAQKAAAPAAAPDAEPEAEKPAKVKADKAEATAPVKKVKKAKKPRTVKGAKTEAAIAADA